MRCKESDPVDGPDIFKKIQGVKTTMLSKQIVTAFKTLTSNRFFLDRELRLCLHLSPHDSSLDLSLEAPQQKPTPKLSLAIYLSASTRRKRGG
jgi:hypothetical protein